MLLIGDKMPAFSVADQNGNIVTNEQLVVRKPSFTSIQRIAPQVVLRRHATCAITTSAFWRKDIRCMV